MSWRGSFMAIFEQIDHLPIWIIIRFNRNIIHYEKKVIDDLMKKGQEINILLVKHNFLTVTIKVSCYTSIIGKVLFNRSETLDYTSPWRISTLKYLEMKIEEWPSRGKWGQVGPNGAKWCQMVPNRVKRGHTGSNGAKKGQKEPTERNVAKRAKWGQTWPNGVIWGWFFACTHIFMRLKNHI